MASRSLLPGPSVALETLGCKLNQADTDLLAAAFQQAGFAVTPRAGEADVFVLNTCTVTHVADRKARKRLRAVRRANPDAVIVATGCYAERAVAEIRRDAGADLVVGNRGKTSLVERLLEHAPALGADRPAWVPVVQPGPEPNRWRRIRAFVKIQEGCRYGCAFCIVPRVRGGAKSEPADDVLRVVRERLAAGYREIVLTGTEVGDYGLLDGSLQRLVHRILDETGVERLRISSLQPQELTPGLLELWQDERLCPHFHIALQSGSPAVLERMRRPYTRDGYLAATDRVRRAVPAASITTDVIAGFPGETEADFAETLAVVRQVGFAAVHAFPYSPRKGTAATRLPDPVPERVIADRMQRLLAASQAQALRRRQERLGQLGEVLWEEPVQLDGAAWLTGLTGDYLRVYAPVSGGAEPGSITRVRLAGLVGDGIRAEPAGK